MGKRKITVEECFKLKLSDLPKGLLWPDKDINGVVIKSNGLRTVKIEYKRNNDRGISIFLKIIKNDLKFDQTIKIDFDYANYGLRPYLLCSCERRCNNLYLRPDGYVFACRDCGRLVYELTRINRIVDGSEIFYRHNRLNKIKTAEEDVKRIVYSGKPTRKAAALMRMCTKWHIDEVAKALINEYLARSSVHNL
jgi:hypothetical protein